MQTFAIKPHARPGRVVCGPGTEQVPQPLPARGQGNVVPGREEPVVKPAQVAEKYVYRGGSFARHAANGKSEWVESKADGSAEFHFAETGRDNQWIRLFDSSRGMALRLPVGSGTCSWSTDDGTTWNALYHVDKAK